MTTCYKDIDFTAVEKTGTWISQSEICGTNSKALGCIIALELFKNEIPVMDFARRNQFVMGNHNIPYDAMLAAFREHGGKHLILERTANRAAITLEYDGNKQDFSLTWEDALKEPFVYEGKDKDIIPLLEKNDKSKLKLKNKYATPRSRTTMLFARVVSDSVRAMAPEVVFGFYTPEEIGDINDAEGQDATVSEPSKSPAKPTSSKSSNDEAVATSDSSSTPEETAAVETESVETKPGATSVALSDPLTDHQYEQIKEMMAQIKQNGDKEIANKIKAKLASCNIVGGLRALTVEEGDELLKQLGTKNIQAWIENVALKGHDGVPS